MVHGQQGRLRGRERQLGVEPGQPLGVQLAAGPAGDRRVQGDEPQRAEVGRVLHGRGGGAGQPEAGAKPLAAVVVAPEHVHRHRRGRQQLVDPRVPLVGPVLDQIPRDQQRVGTVGQSEHRVEHRHEPSVRVGPAPLASDVRIADLRDAEGGQHRREPSESENLTLLD
jgi:hypothetical protein